MDIHWDKRCLGVFSVIVNRIFVKLADNKGRHKTLNEFEFWPGRTFHYGVICLWAFPLTLNGENGTSIFFSVTMNSVFSKLTGNEDRHKISDEFEFRSYLTSHFGVMCP